MTGTVGGSQWARPTFLPWRRWNCPVGVPGTRAQGIPCPIEAPGPPRTEEAFIYRFTEVREVRPWVRRRAQRAQAWQLRVRREKNPVLLGRSPVWDGRRRPAASGVEAGV